MSRSDAESANLKLTYLFFILGQGRDPPWSAEVDLCWQAAGGRQDSVRLQHSERVHSPSGELLILVRLLSVSALVRFCEWFSRKNVIYSIPSVFRIRYILVRIRICGSVPHTNGSRFGSSSGSCCFRQPTKIFFSKFFALWLFFWRMIYMYRIRIRATN